jgi:hypothetical protein
VRKVPKKSLLLSSIVLIYDFHATFDRGVKIEIFVSPQCASMGHRVDFVKVEKRPVGTSVASQKVALSALG